jgi:PilZ domain-containing protein
MAWDGEERRRSHRARCTLPIELRAEGSAFPAQAETSDVGLTGCYVTTMFPLPIGTKLNGALSIGSRRIAVKCEVITMDPSLGNGIKFVEMSEADKTELKTYLENSASPETDSDSGYIIR